MAAYEVSLYCSCGDSMRFTVRPAEADAGLRQAWASLHSAGGHHEVDAAAARAARRRRDRARARARVER